VLFTVQTGSLLDVFAAVRSSAGRDRFRYSQDQTKRPR